MKIKFFETSDHIFHIRNITEVPLNNDKVRVAYPGRGDQILLTIGSSSQYIWPGQSLTPGRFYSLLSKLGNLTPDISIDKDTISIGV